MGKMLESPYDIGDRVFILGLDDYGHVAAISWSGEGLSFRCIWFSGGTRHVGWLNQFEIAKDKPNDKQLSS
jgi:hypothetical protein